MIHDGRMIHDDESFLKKSTLAGWTEGRKDGSKGDEQTVSQVFTLINAHDWVWPHLKYTL